MKVSEIAHRMGLEFCGKDIDVKSIRFSQDAKENDIGIIRKGEEINNTKAECLLMKPTLTYIDKVSIFAVEDIEITAVKIAYLIHQKELNQREQNYTLTKDGYYIGSHSIVGEGNSIAPNVYIGKNVVIGEGCMIEPNVRIGNNTILGNNICIGFGSVIGSNSFYHYLDKGLKEFSGIGRTIIQNNVNVGNNTTIQRGTFSDTIIGEGCKIGNSVDIGHDVHIGKGCKIVSQTGIAGGVKIGDDVLIYGQVGIANDVVIGDSVTIMAKSLVTKNINSYETISGIYARNHNEELRMFAKIHRL